MAFAEVVAEHAEAQEVVRLLLAGFAAEITAQGFDLGRFLSEGESYLAGFFNLLIQDFAALGADEVLAGANAYLQEIDLAGGALSAADRRGLISDAMTRVNAGGGAFTRGIAADFGAWVQGLQAAGMTDQDILDTVTTSPEYLKRVLGRWQNGVKDAARQFVTVLDDASYELAWERRSKREKLPNEHVWVTRYDRKVCGREEAGASAWRVSCWHRHGMVKSYVEWKRAGLPGSGSTYCRRRCRCILAPSARVRDVDLSDPVEIREAMKGAQRRAERRMREIAAYAKKRAPAYRTV